MPAYSSVCIRTLRVDPYKVWEEDIPVAEKIRASYTKGGTLWAMKAFHANKLEWTYRLNSAFVQEARKLAFSVGGARAPNVSQDAKNPRDIAVIQLDGEPLGDWPGGYQGCAVNPGFRDYQLKHAARVVGEGADTFQHDCAGMAATWQTCYCDHCLSGFRNWLAATQSSETLRACGVDNTGSYDHRQAVSNGNAPAGVQPLWRQFKFQAIRDYHQSIRDSLRARFPHFTAYTGNNSSYQMYDVRFEPFDFFISELMFASCDPVRLFERHDVVMAAGKAQSYHAPKAHAGESMDYMKPLCRSVIGFSYAMGAWMAAPYDLFRGADLPRYFGEPCDYADLYGFIRANAELLDGYERAAYAGAWLADERAGNVLLIEGGSGGAYAFARTRPGDPDAPIVIHLVDWGRELEFVPGRFRDQSGFNQSSYKRGPKEPFTLKIRRENCYGDRAFAAHLLTPPAYDETAHSRAEEADDYSALSESRPVSSTSDREYAAFAIPRLDPYAILVLRLSDD
jgi:hypothetical protein